MRLSARALILLGWGLLLLAWAVANPPFAAPDETDHYIRAIGVGQGQLIGGADSAARIGLTARQVAWTRQSARLVRMAGALDPQPYSCATGSGTGPATCLNHVVAVRSEVMLATAVGNYEPLPYVLPALAMKLPGTTPSAVRFGRAAGAAVVLALFAIALAALWDGALLSVAGLLVAVTPMAIFCGAIIGGSGMEIAAAIAFTSCLLRLSRGDRQWALAAGCGCVLVLSRPASLIWLICILVAVAAWSGTRRGWVVILAPVIAAAALDRVWQSLYGSRVTLDFDQLHAGVVAGWHQWWRALSELVGKFGYLDVRLPALEVILWLGVALGLVGAAATASRRSARFFAVLVAAALVLPPVFYALLTRPTGFGLQGRQLLPALVLVPLLAGETLWRSGRGRAVARLLPIAAAVGQLTAWYVDAHRFAVGTSGPFWFAGAARWSPPLGWWPWLAVAVCGASSVGAAAMTRR